ncbi:MAG: hypothetical protein IPM18_04500 [Phycisphaerales bacterium]|nr:hypothetical protein [Phycisphaerales bacterium]
MMRRNFVLSAVLTAAVLVHVGWADEVTQTGNLSVSADCRFNVNCFGGLTGAPATFPVVSETSGPGEWAVGSVIRLLAPAGFEFDTTGGNEPIATELSGDATFALTAAPTVTANTVEFEVAAVSTVNNAELRISNIRLRPTTDAAANVANSPHTLQVEADGSDPGNRLTC